MQQWRYYYQLFGQTCSAKQVASISSCPVMKIRMSPAD